MMENVLADLQKKYTNIKFLFFQNEIHVQVNVDKTDEIREWNELNEENKKLNNKLEFQLSPVGGKIKYLAKTQS